MKTLLPIVIFASTCLAPWSHTATAAAPTLDPSLPWAGDNRARLDALIATHGSTSPGYDPANKPVAVFDWDNTVIKNDIGEGTGYWLLNNDAILAPPGSDWSATSRWLTPMAIEALDKACGEHPPGKPLPTRTDVDCADELLAILERSKTAAGLEAFASEGYSHRQLRPSLAWLAQLLAGRTLAEVEAFTEQAIEANLAAPAGATQTVGSTEDAPAWIRVYDQSRDLISTLQEAGFDVWVVSASPEPIVIPFARRVGVAADHVIGIRTLTDADGRLTYHLPGCGPVADGEDAVVTYQQGKRCWINKVIFGVEGDRAMERNPDPARRPVFVAGDANTDAEMLRDAVALRLLINRNKPEVMCRASADPEGWLVNPMFIEPLPPRTELYPCSSEACKDDEGKKVPCLDDEGQVIPDQLRP